MKTLVSYVALTIFVLASSFTMDVQQNLNHQTTQTSGCFNYFRTHRQGKGVATTWSVSAADVTQFVVERSYDGDFYDEATTINFDGSSSYKFIDQDVYPGVVYYRIKAVKADATTEYSAVETVHIVQKH
ncbi:MAG: hypothetical protein ACXVMS_17700 [Flavisolibacter sp.]